MSEKRWYRNARLSKEKKAALKEKMTTGEIIGKLKAMHFFGDICIAEETILDTMAVCITDDTIENRPRIRQIVFIDMDYFLVFLALDAVTAESIREATFDPEGGTLTFRNFMFLFPGEIEKRPVDVVFRSTDGPELDHYAFYTADEHGQPLGDPPS